MTRVSQEAVASRAPSGENSHDTTSLWWPSSLRMSVYLSMSHRKTCKSRTGRLQLHCSACQHVHTHTHSYTEQTEKDSFKHNLNGVPKVCSVSTAECLQTTTNKTTKNKTKRKQYGHATQAAKARLWLHLATPSIVNPFTTWLSSLQLRQTYCTRVHYNYISLQGQKDLHWQVNIPSYN